MIQEKWLLIGHRGAGKSSFLQGLSAHFEVCIDLDVEIEQRSQQRITDIFAKFGEVGFRQLESAVFEAILKENQRANSIVIALGAGFGAHIWPKDYRCLWLRKESDVWPRYFRNRPQMGTSSPGSFLGAYIEREQRYQAWADVAWTFPEGFALWPSEIVWPLDVTVGEGACLTLVPRLHKDAVASMRLRKNWQLRFELRSDLWPVATLKKACSEFTEPLLLSVRTETFPLAEIFPNGQPDHVWLDWDFAFGEIPPGFVPNIISQHDFSAGLGKGLAQLEKLSLRFPQVLLKASPILSTYADVEILWKWQRKDPERRMIYPRSRSTLEHSQWQWFRLLLKGKQKINFVREATEGPKDQPTIAQYAEHSMTSHFAAILGQPVLHSLSPFFHRRFFREQAMTFLAVPLNKEELNEKTFHFLEQLGLRAAAVTSPHKESETLLKLSTPGESSAQECGNTLVKNADGKWMRFNTDQTALKALYAPSLQSWRIWGSGAVARQSFAQLANAEMYSSRTGEKVAEKGVVQGGSFNVLWAAGDEAKAPPEHWKPNKIYDLSYTQRSQAILYANAAQVDYENGWEFFKIQALAQQELWKDLKKE